MDVQNFVKSEAILLAWREEQSNGVNGMLGVLFTLRNRAKAGWEGGDWLKLITAHNQFSSMSVLGDGQTVRYPDIRDPLFLKLCFYIDGIYAGTTPDTTDGALYYADLNSSGFQKDGWFARTILANPTRFPRRTTIGTTTYFGEVDAPA